MKIGPILTRIEGQCPSLVSVLPAQALQALTDIDLQTPSVYVHIEEEITEGSELDLYTSQRVEYHVSVITVARNYDRDTTEEELDDVRTELFAALLGWQPDVNSEPCIHLGGRIVSISAQLIWWRDTWATASLRRQA